MVVEQLPRSRQIRPCSELEVRYLISTGQSLHYEQNHVVYEVTTRPTSMILGKSRTYNHDQGIQDSTKAG